MQYLDSAATTPVSVETAQLIHRYLCDDYYNPSAMYTPAFDVAKAVNNARSEIAKYIGCSPNEIFFTSGASESNSWAFQGWLKAHPYGAIITTPIEHHSIMAMKDDITIGKNIRLIGVSTDGTVDVMSLEQTIQDLLYYGVAKNDILVSIQFANNEIGTIQDFQLISQLVKGHNITLHTDATQAFSCLNNFEIVKKYNLDMLSMSGHKIGCPKGIGILYKKKYVEIAPLIYGTQNFGLRGGTENVPSIVALGDAFHWMLIRKEDVQESIDHLCGERDLLFSAIDKITPIKLNGSTANRLANNLNITFKENIVGEAMAAVLSALGVYVSRGSACNSAVTETSHVLKAIGVPDEDALKTIRLSLPNGFNERDLHEVTKAFKTAVDLLLHKGVGS